MVFKKKNVPDTIPSENKIVKKSSEISANPSISEQMVFAKN